MQNPIYSFSLFIGLLIVCMPSCKKETITPEPDETIEALYFPEIGSNEWETTDINDLGWNLNELPALYTYLEENDTRAFIVLKNGKIVLEQYWGNNILNTDYFDVNSQWYWASAGKTIISFLIGIAQQENQLDISNKSSDYLGKGWTSMPLEKEDLITVRHHLSMSTGLDYRVQDANCTTSSCLSYKANAGNEWFYYNAPYLLLRRIITNATGIDYKTYTQQQLENKIGMQGAWIGNDLESLYWSTARDMARFGLLILHKGKWQDKQILTDEAYFKEMTTTSQNLNPSYGYLWWLNGKNKIIYPTLPISINQSLSSNAPNDLIAGIGKNGQYVDVIPSQNLVLIRMGEAPDNSAVPVKFHDEMWEKLNRVMMR